MKNFKALFELLKKNSISIIFLLFTISLILFSNTNLTAAKSGLLLFANSVVPSLLPFFIATELLSTTNIIQIVGKLLNKVMRPVFNVPGEGAYAFLIGFISGYPVGAKIVTKLREDGICSKSEGERMLVLSNNSGPLFIIGTVGISLFASSETGFLLLATHILACITVGIILGLVSRFKYNDTNNSSHSILVTKQNNCNFYNLGEILGNSIKNAIFTVTTIGGFVVLFSVIISILEESHIIDIICNLINPIFKVLDLNVSLSKALITGIIELTNGVKIAILINSKKISSQIILCAFLLGFGGISVLLQVLSITSKSDLSIKPYILGKFLQGIFASFYTYIAIYYIPFFNLDLQPVSSPENTIISNDIFNFSSIIFFSFLLIFILLIYTMKLKKSKKTYFRSKFNTIN